MNSSFEPEVWGTPDPDMPRDEYERIIADARRNGQNVYFGDAWRDKSRFGILYAAQPPVETSWRSIVSSVVAWFGL